MTSLQTSVCYCILDTRLNTELRSLNNSGEVWKGVSELQTLGIKYVLIWWAYSTWTFLRLVVLYMIGAWYPKPLTAQTGSTDARGSWSPPQSHSLTGNSSPAQGHGSCRRSEATDVDLGGTLSYHNFCSKASACQTTLNNASVGLVSPLRFLCPITQSRYDPRCIDDQLLHRVHQWAGWCTRHT